MRPGESPPKPPEPAASWQDWDASAWGRALLRHYFAARDAQPVSRLAISAEELAKAAGAPDASVASVQYAFLQAIRCSPAAFRRRLSDASLEPSAWNQQDPPPFLSYLFFTCFAAASLDTDVADEGVFRERVRRLLNHEAGTSYPFEHLSRLWEAFSVWLEGRRDEGAAYRVLILPDRGHLLRIGYSVRLAFPRREDRVRLRGLLAAAGLGANPTVPEALQAIGRARDRFSPGFQHVYDRARAAMVMGRSNPELEALWSAILEAAALAVAAEERQPRTRFQLMSQEDELGRIDPFVVVAKASTESFAAGNGMHFSMLDEPAGDFDHLLCAADGTTGLIAQLVMKGALQDRVPGFARSPVARAVREGVLLFRQRDISTWELAFTRPSEGRVRGLVRAHLSGAFLALIRGATRRAHDTRFEGWREIQPFDVTDLTTPAYRDVPALADIRCLQQVEVGPRLHLVGGIRVDGGYLGLPGLLPEVHCADADGAALFGLPDGGGSHSSDRTATLQPLAGRAGGFGWPSETAELEGAFVLAAMQADRVIAPREIHFHARGLRHEYRGPTHPEAWFTEHGALDVVPVGTSSSDRPNANSAMASDAFLTAELGNATGASAFDIGVAESVGVLRGRSADDDVAHDRIVETLAAVSATRAGLPEAALIEIFGKVAPSATGHRVWSMVRAWLEAGYLDCFTRRHWRGRVYFARRPRVVLVPDQGASSVRAVLHGLAPYRLRNAMRRAFGDAGATQLPALSLSECVPAPPGWLFASRDHFIEAITAVGESERALEVVGLCAPRELVGDFIAAVSDETLPPPGYEREHVWDWAAGGFRRPDRDAGGGVRIEHFTRINGPDRWVVIAEDHRRSTLSRSWALLCGFRLARKAAFAAAGPMLLSRSGDDGPFVPLPLARAIGLRAGIVGGPVESAELGRHYAYATEGPAMQRWLLGWLNGVAVQGMDSGAVRRFAWLRAATAGHAMRQPLAVSQFEAALLPADLRRRLRAIDALPDARALATRRVPRHLRPHVRRAVEISET